ncbi:MAG: putative lipoprotein [Solirubrobacterales bacterium]|nr:putative lipoprotein [Solirubrobacterales bacterium]
MTLPDSRISRDTGTKFQGAASYKFTVQGSDRDPFSSGQRSELGMGNPTRSDMQDRLFQRGQERWISWASRLGTDWNTNPGTWQLTNQWKQLGGLGSPILSMEQTGGVFRMDRTTSDPNNQWPSGFQSNVTVCPAVQTGRWYKWTLHIKFDPSASVGFVEWFGDCGSGGPLTTILAKRFQSTQKISNGQPVTSQARIGIYRNTMSTGSTLWIDAYNVATTRALAEYNAGF